MDVMHIHRSKSRYQYGIGGIASYCGVEMAEAATMAVVQAAVAAAVAATVAVAVAMAALAAGMAAVVAAAAATTNWIGGRGFSASASWIRGVSHLLAVAVAVAMAALAAGTAAVVAAAAAATTNWIGGRNDGSRWWIFRIGIMDPWGGRRHLGVRDAWPWL